MYGIVSNRVLTAPFVYREVGCKSAGSWRGTHIRTRSAVKAVPMESGASEEATEVAITSDNSKEAVGDSLAQYIVIRKDLVESLKWPLGSVLAQACHASVAAIWLYKDHPHTLQYCGDLDSMTKVTLEVKGEIQLMNLASKLEENGIAHKLWIEQPENFPTCLATKPYPKAEVSQFFKKLKLCK
ncbi:hypothetical protein KP509_12G004100 [Ceratopteris richardii]|uniref:peptidyl-tRNA hydrolase n=1 Tax=Ceratopteris richardii TaxID=49495 RepID=A0A8T2TKR6_CERRI|nr:hypothetical protein KP509_12G004100 [Ceratopteris richardii]